MWYDFYISKVLEDVELLIIQISFKPVRQKNRLKYWDHRDVNYVAKWLRILSKIFIRSMKI